MRPEGVSEGLKGECVEFDHLIRDKSLNFPKLFYHELENERIFFYDGIDRNLRWNEKSFPNAIAYVRVACDDNSSQFFSSAYKFSNSIIRDKSFISRIKELKNFSL